MTDSAIAGAPQVEKVQVAQARKLQFRYVTDVEEDPYGNIFTWSDWSGVTDYEPTSQRDYEENGVPWGEEIAKVFDARARNAH